MGERFSTPRQREIATKFLIQRDGSGCLRCGSTIRKLEIDHSDGDKRNWDPDNLSLLCAPCNVMMRSWGSSKHVQLIRKYRDVRERDREKEPVQTETARLKVDYSQGSIEMQATNIYELRVRDYALGLVTEQGPVEKKDLANSSAEAAGCSPLTAARYIDKMTSREGALKEYRDVTGKLVIALKKSPKGRRAVKDAEVPIDG